MCVSAFIVSDEADAVAILADTVWDHYGLATAGTLRRAGYQIIGTDIEDEGELIPHSDRHVDVVVWARLPQPAWNFEVAVPHLRPAVR